jgi:AAA+ superfamily predicted ATPase
MTSPTKPDWTDANQRLMAAELARIKSLFAREDTDPAREDLDIMRRELPGPAAIDIITGMFGLSGFEKDILLLAAGVEMDSDFAAMCGQAAGQPSRPWATFGLAMGLLPDPHWSALTPVRPLRRWQLIDVEERSGLALARIRIDERILHYLAGIDYLDERLRPLLRPIESSHIMAEDQQGIARSIVHSLQKTEISPPVICLSGDDADGQEDVAACVAADLNLTPYAIAAGNIPANGQELDALATLWQREAALTGCALLIEKLDSAEIEFVRRFVERIGTVTFVSSREPQQFRRPTLRFSVNRPHAPEQRRLWREILGPMGDSLDGALDAIASQYRLSARAISVGAQKIAPLLGDGEITNADAWQSVLRSGASTLEALAQRIEPMASWNDLILPEAQKTTLREISSHVRNRIRVYHDWGFAAKSARGLGISALFYGDSGTGKTMAAEVLAGELNLELYRIDLSAVVSKYIGETEKNLQRVFDGAEESGAILLFDEADALFGKRSEVKDSHDRYANIEISYLLQRMEAYRGLAILTTNLKSALDTAFQRRLRFVVQFPFPDVAQRELIWRGIFPDSMPRDGIDFGKLARLDVTGGSIRNIALNAAFSAAEEGKPLSMRHLARAARSDAAKRERTLTDAETRGWV